MEMVTAPKTSWYLVDGLGREKAEPCQGSGIGEVSSASCEETQASRGLRAVGREAGMDRAGTSEGGSASWKLTGVRGG